MAKYKPTDYAQTQLVAVSLAEQLVPGTLEHTIHYVVEQRLDLASFDAQRKNDETGAPGYDPRVLLKVVLLGYSRGLLSSRQLEAACRGQILFMALTCGQTPDHSTIATFVSGMGEGREGGQRRGHALPFTSRARQGVGCRHAVAGWRANTRWSFPGHRSPIGIIQSGRA